MMTSDLGVLTCIKCGYDNRFNDDELCSYCGDKLKMRDVGLNDKLLGRIIQVNDVSINHYDERSAWTRLEMRKSASDIFYNTLAKHGYRVVNVHGNSVYIANKSQSEHLIRMVGVLDSEVEEEDEEEHEVA